MRRMRGEGLEVCGVVERRGRLRIGVGREAAEGAGLLGFGFGLSSAESEAEGRVGLGQRMARRLKSLGSGIVVVGEDRRA